VKFEGSARSGTPRKTHYVIDEGMPSATVFRLFVGDNLKDGHEKRRAGILKGKPGVPSTIPRTRAASLKQKDLVSQKTIRQWESEWTANPLLKMERLLKKQEEKEKSDLVTTGPESKNRVRDCSSTEISQKHHTGIKEDEAWTGTILSKGWRGPSSCREAPAE